MKLRIPSLNFRSSEKLARENACTRDLPVRSALRPHACLCRRILDELSVGVLLPRMNTYKPWRSE